MKKNKLIVTAVLLLSVSFSFSTASFSAGDDRQEAFAKLQNRAAECRKTGDKRCNRAVVEGKRNYMSEKYKTFSKQCYAGYK